MTMLEKIKPTEANYVDITTIDTSDRPHKNGFQSKILNENTPGKAGGMCVVFGAPTGVGKTTFTLSEVYQSIEDGKKVVYYTTESDPKDIILTLCNIAGYYKVSDRDSFRDSLTDQLIIIDDKYDINRIKWLFDTFQFDELYLDYLDTSMCKADTASAKSAAINRQVRYLREFAKEYDRFVWVCAQAKYLPEGEYTKDAFYESTTICNAATLAIILHGRRAEVDTFNEDCPYVLEIVKNRYMSEYAPTGTKIYFTTKSKFSTFAYKEHCYVVNGVKHDC